MADIERIRDYVAGKLTVTVPELQRAFSLGYAEAVYTVKQLVKEGALLEGEGLEYRVLIHKEEPEEDFSDEARPDVGEATDDSDIDYIYDLVDEDDSEEAMERKRKVWRELFFGDKEDKSDDDEEEGEEPVVERDDEDDDEDDDDDDDDDDERNDDSDELAQSILRQAALHVGEMFDHIGRDKARAESLNRSIREAVCGGFTAEYVEGQEFLSVGGSERLRIVRLGRGGYFGDQGHTLETARDKNEKDADRVVRAVARACGGDLAEGEVRVPFHALSSSFSAAAGCIAAIDICNRFTRGDIELCAKLLEERDFRTGVFRDLSEKYGHLPRSLAVNMLRTQYVSVKDGTDTAAILDSIRALCYVENMTDAAFNFGMSIARTECEDDPFAEPVAEEDTLYHTVGQAAASLGATLLGSGIGPAVRQFRLSVPGIISSAVLREKVEKETRLSPVRVHISRGKAVVEIPKPASARRGADVWRLLTQVGHGTGKFRYIVGEGIDGRDVFGDLAEGGNLLLSGGSEKERRNVLKTMIGCFAVTYPPDELELFLLTGSLQFYPFEGSEAFPGRFSEHIFHGKNGIRQGLWKIYSEAMHRLLLFTKAGAEDISAYNEGREEKLPRILAVIDCCPEDDPPVIQKIMEYAKTTGVHLFLAARTLRPEFSDRDCPADRLLLAVKGDKEKAGEQTTLLGGGDLLFEEGGKDPVRVQAPFLTDNDLLEVEDQIDPPRPDKPRPEMVKAIAVAVRKGSVSAVSLREELGVSLVMAVRMIRWMVENKYIERQEGRGEIFLQHRALLSRSEFEKRFGPLDSV